MATNEHSTSGYLEDLIRSMTQLCALELHVKTQLERLNQDLQDVESSEVDSVLNQLMQEEEHLMNIQELRRESMRLIMEHQTDQGNDKKWCEVKHSAMAMYTAFEVYQATGHASHYNYFLKTNDLFIQVMIDFLGYDIPPCASCFSDRLLDGKGGEEDDGV